MCSGVIAWLQCGQFISAISLKHRAASVSSCLVRLVQIQEAHGLISLDHPRSWVLAPPGFVATFVAILFTSVYPRPAFMRCQ